MGNSNKRAKEELIRLYGEECFIDKLHLRKGKKDERYKGKGQYKKMKQLTYHHIVKKEHGGRATVENGALLSAENHAWFNKQSLSEQARLNNIFQQYKIAALEMRDGEIIQHDVIELDFDFTDYYSIPVKPDDRVYNRAKVKEETRQTIEKYYEGEER